MLFLRKFQLMYHLLIQMETKVFDCVRPLFLIYIIPYQFSLDETKRFLPCYLKILFLKLFVE